MNLDQARENLAARPVDHIMAIWGDRVALAERLVEQSEWADMPVSVRNFIADWIHEPVDVIYANNAAVASLTRRIEAKE